MILFFDLETRSQADLEVCGLDNYARHPSTQITLCSWGFGDRKISLWQPLREPIPEELKKGLLDPAIKKCAWNASFERNLVWRCLGIWIPFEQWLDPMTYARHLSLPGSLEECGEVLGLKEDEAKIKDGKRLIAKFCYPQKMGSEVGLFEVKWEKCKEGEPQYNEFKDFEDWETDPEDWQKFGEYCIRDTETERTLLNKMKSLPLPESEQQIWYLDQKINHAGLPVNMTFVENALWMAEKSKAELDAKQKERTGLENPNSRDQMLAWATAQGYPYHSLRKEFVKAALSEKNQMSELCREVLKTRQEASKTSYKKMQRIKELVSPDNRVRNQYLFMGAARTARWSGTGFQPQNPPRPTKEVEATYDQAVELIFQRNYDAIKEKYSSVMDVIASCTRSAIWAPEGKKLVVCDLSAIENRVLGWVAGCDAILKVFRDNLDPYVAFAVLMYGLPYEVLIKDKTKRQIAKPAVLGAGYGLGPGVEKIPNGEGGFIYRIMEKTDSYGNTIRTGLLGYAENMGIKLTPEQAYHAWEVFRKSYPEVVQLWRDLENAAISVLKNGGREKVGPVTFDRKKREDGTVILRIELPSGRHIHYLGAKIEMRELIGKDGQPYEKEGILYQGIGHGTGKIGEGWGPTRLYGGKAAENIVQAISRDLLASGMQMADKIGFEIVGHAHDELICISDDDPLSPGLEDLRWSMNFVPAWAARLPLASDGYEGVFYKK